MTEFFWKEASGLKADIDRHRKQEAKLKQRITELENQDDPDAMDERALRAYRYFLCRLQQSKANVVNKIGRKQ